MEDRPVIENEAAVRGNIGHVIDQISYISENCISQRYLVNKAVDLIEKLDSREELTAITTALYALLDQSGCLTENMEFRMHDIMRKIFPIE